MRYRFAPLLSVTAMALLVPLAASAAPPSETTPVVRAETDGFEIIGRLETRGLVLYIDQFATNQPVLDAQLSLESGGQTGPARLDATTGTYVVDAAPLLSLWQKPGDHEISFTLITPQASDLLLGKLSIPEHSLIGPWSEHLPGITAGLLISAGLALLALVYRRRQGLRSRQNGGRA